MVECQVDGDVAGSNWCPRQLESGQAATAVVLVVAYPARQNRTSTGNGGAARCLSGGGTTMVVVLLQACGCTAEGAGWVQPWGRGEVGG